MKHFQLCNTDQFKSQVSKVLNQAYEIDKATYPSIFSIYKDENHTVDKHIMPPKTADNEFLFNFNSAESIVGLDVPTMLCQSSKSKGVIFIVGEDPLRETAMKDFERFGDKILLSTPFALHLSDNAKYARQFKLYYDIYDFILQTNHDIYLTDVNKVWMKMNGATKKSIIPEDLKQKFVESLNLEIATFSPKLVVTFGKPAGIALSSFKSIQTVNFIHPAFTARNHWKKIKELNENTSDQAILDYIKQKIQSQLQPSQTSSQ